MEVNSTADLVAARCVMCVCFSFFFGQGCQGETMRSINSKISAEHAIMRAIDTLLSEYESMSISEAQILLAQANDSMMHKIRWSQNGQRVLSLTN